ncbi:hypothetical protein RRG08_060123 [Elysia crispata]|uniref:Uncharacterized protein n=1 Tax=Elysia crispata TaxID=231223 RepID=A0AAE1BD52_9GAST|nr:hypothetical protein RRG08_060123 [Elysia crispata]
MDFHKETKQREHGDTRMWNVEEEGQEVLYFVAGVNKICAASGGERKKRVGKWEEGRSYGGRGAQSSSRKSTLRSCKERCSKNTYLADDVGFNTITKHRRCCQPASSLLAWMATMAQAEEQISDAPETQDS